MNEITPRSQSSFSELSAFIWSVADLLRGDYKNHDFGKVILPFTVLRRLDCVLEETKAEVLVRHEKLQHSDIENLDPLLQRITGRPFHNVSKLDFGRLCDAPEHIAENLNGYLQGFSKNVQDIFVERFKIGEQIDKLDGANLLFQVVQRFSEIDLHPEAVSNHTMGSVFEDLIRRFAEQSNETAGEHFTPRDVIQLMVNLLFTEDSTALTQPGTVRTIYDPACGTGGMLSVAEEHLRELNPHAELKVFGQELNDETFAICKADMLIKGQEPEQIKPGNTFSDQGHQGMSFDYMLSNPPFGVEWKKVQDKVKDEHEKLGHAGRFGAGLPRINDGSLLFLLHMLSKMKPNNSSEGGSRLAIVFNGSPLFTGDAGSGESEIRRWILENDWLEAIVALPDQLFFNTGISTYIWVLSNRKLPERRGKVQLIHGVNFFEKMRKSLGDKRKLISEAQIAELSRIFGEFEGDTSEERQKLSKVFCNEDFGFRKITVERPLRLDFQMSPERVARLEHERAFENLGKSRKKGEAALKEIEEGQAQQQQIREVLGTLDPSKLYLDRAEFHKDLRAAAKASGLKLRAPVEKAVLSALSERNEDAALCMGKKGQPEADSDLRDTESVPLAESIEEYFEREVKPHVPDAWVDEAKTKIGYEIPLTRHFYEYVPPRDLGEIEAEIRELENEIGELLGAIAVG